MKPILFIDFDGTLCHDRFWRSVDSEKFEKIQTFLFGKDQSLINAWMRGIHPSEYVNQLLAQELKMPLEKLWETFVTDCERMSVPSDSLRKIQRFRETFHTILITDNMDCFTRFTVPAQRLDEHFDLIVSSFDYRKLKKDNGGELFLDILRGGDARVEDCILIDNSRKACDTFTNLGGRSCFVSTDTPLDYWLAKLKNEHNVG